tara:strand:- start:10030 stop:10392 length:363 start_codon:yes stop_codon:yes gene_type:complete
MANPLKAQVDIKLGDTDYKARLTIDAIIQIEEKVGCGIIKLATRMGDADIRMVDLLSVLTPALRGGGNNIQEKEVKKIISEIGIVATAQAVAELLTASLQPPKEEGDEEEAQKKKEEQEQ